MNAETTNTPTPHSLHDSLIHRYVDDSSTPTMSSLEIAELAEKRHDNVVRDIRKMLAELNISALKFEGCYRGHNGKEVVLFNLPKRETLVLVAGYLTEVRARIIDRWMELEGSTRPMTPAEANLANAKLMVDMERRQAAIEVKQAEQDERIANNDRRLNQIETATDHFTTIGYARAVRGTSIDYRRAAEIGRHATRRAKHLGIQLSKVPDPRFGAVSQYPKSILDFAWDEVFSAIQ